MQYRYCNSLKRNISEISLGTWGLDKYMWGKFDEKEIYKTFEAARILGINFIDTAQDYKGVERLVGRIIKDLSWHDAIVATKIPPKIYSNNLLKASQAYLAEYIISQIERSLICLGLEQILLLQLHTWNSDWFEEEEWIHTLLDLKKQGKIGAIGLSLVDHMANSGIEIIKSGCIDFIQVMYNLFDQSAKDKLLDVCFKNSVSVIARSVLYEGFFSGKIDLNYEFNEGDWRKKYFTGIHFEACLERLKMIYSDGISPDNIASYAICFALSHPSITTVILGMRSVKHVWENTRVSESMLLSKSELNKIRKYHWLTV